MRHSVFGEGGNQNRVCGRDWWEVRQEKWAGPDCKDPHELWAMYSFNKYLLGSYYVSGTVLGAGSQQWTKQSLCPPRGHSSGEDR